MFSKSSYLQDLLKRYQAFYDITEEFKLGNINYPAYARFYSFSEKYVLKKEARLWAIKAYEHVLFMEEDEVNEETLQKLKQTIIDYAEPELVRKHAKYPEKDHMCTYLTFIILSSDTPNQSIQTAIKKFSYDKGYLLNFRGHCEAKLAVVSMNSKSVLTNYPARDLREMLEDVFKSESNAAS